MLSMHFGIPAAAGCQQPQTGPCLCCSSHSLVFVNLPVSLAHARHFQQFCAPGAFPLVPLSLKKASDARNSRDACTSALASYTFGCQSQQCIVG